MPKAALEAQCRSGQAPGNAPSRRWHRHRLLATAAAVRLRLRRALPGPRRAAAVSRELRRARAPAGRPRRGTARPAYISVEGTVVRATPGLLLTQCEGRHRPKGGFRPLREALAVRDVSFGWLVLARVRRRDGDLEDSNRSRPSGQVTAQSRPEYA